MSRFLPVSNPVWNASIPLSRDDIKRLLKSNAGAISLQTCTIEDEKGASFTLSDSGSTLHGEYSTCSLARTIETVHYVRRLSRKPVIISLRGSAKSLARMTREMNLQFANYEWILFELADASIESFRAMQNETMRPIGVKLSYRDLSERQEIPNEADFFTAFHVIHRRGGRSIRNIVLTAIARLKAMYPNVPIIACGGIETPEDVDAFMENGATYAEIGTALLKKGPSVFAISRVERNLISDFRTCLGDSMNSFAGVPYLWMDMALSVAQATRDIPADAIATTVRACPLASLVATIRGLQLITVHGNKIYGTVCERVLLLDSINNGGRTIAMTEEALIANGFSVVKFSFYSRTDNVPSLFGPSSMGLRPLKPLKRHAIDIKEYYECRPGYSPVSEMERAHSMGIRAVLIRGRNLMDLPSDPSLSSSMIHARMKYNMVILYEDRRPQYIHDYQVLTDTNDAPTDGLPYMLLCNPENLLEERASVFWARSCGEVCALLGAKKIGGESDLISRLYSASPL